MPRLLEKSVLLEETLAKPFPPVITDSESAEGSRATGVPPGRGQGCRVSEASHSPGLLSYPAVTAAKVGLPFLPGREAALVSLCLLPLGCFALESLGGGSEACRHPSVLAGTTPHPGGPGDSCPRGRGSNRPGPRLCSQVESQGRGEKGRKRGGATPSRWSAGRATTAAGSPCRLRVRSPGCPARGRRVVRDAGRVQCADTGPRGAVQAPGL